MIKDKRGLDYIDWALSMGLFLIIVVALFVFLKPGAEPAFSGDNLLDIVETNLLKDAGSVIKETPLFVKKLNNKDATNNNALLKIKLNSDWIFKKVDSTAVFGFLPITVPTRNLVFDCSIGSCNGNFVLVWVPSNPLPSQPDLTINCPSPTNLAVCDALLGSTVTLEGVDSDLIDSLKNKTYAQVRDDWHFPKEKDFSIRVNNTLIIGGQEPGPQANVIVKELKYWEIVGSSRAPATINLRVW